MSVLERRLARERGRMILSRSVEDLQRGLPFGAAAAAVLLVVHHSGLAPFTPVEALSWGAVATLSFPGIGLMVRRISTARVASLVDERLGLQDRVATALAAEQGLLVPSDLHGLLEEDALRSLNAVPVPAFRRAFRPRFHGRAVLLGLLGLGLASAGLIPAPLLASTPTKVDEKLSPREEAEREDAARQARLVRETARKVAEEAAALKQDALREAATDMARKADEMLQKRPPLSTSLASFHRMGEEARRSLEKMAGTTEERMKALEAAGELSGADLQLQRLLAALMNADLESLGQRLQKLQDAMNGDGTPPSMAELARMQQEIRDLQKALEEGAAAMEGREGLKAALGAFGDPELMAELGERMGRLMETLREQGYDPSNHGSPMTAEQMKEALRRFNEQQQQGGGQAMQPPSPEELQSMIDKLKEMQRLAELGRLAFCQGCQGKNGEGGT